MINILLFCKSVKMSIIPLSELYNKILDLSLNSCIINGYIKSIRIEPYKLYYRVGMARDFHCIDGYGKPLTSANLESMINVDQCGVHFSQHLYLNSDDLQILDTLCTYCEIYCVMIYDTDNRLLFGKYPDSVVGSLQMLNSIQIGSIDVVVHPYALTHEVFNLGG